MGIVDVQIFLAGEDFISGKLSFPGKILHKKLNNNYQSHALQRKNSVNHV